MRITSIRTESPAADVGLRAGDDLLAINGKPISDIIDFLYHASDGTITSVLVEPRDGGLLIGEATPLYNTRLQPSGYFFWALSPDGERVLAMETGTEHDAPNLSVVVNWLESVR